MMLKLDNVDYGDTKIIELETFINVPFNDNSVVENMDSVTLKVFRNEELVMEKQFEKNDSGEYYVYLHTHDLPSPDTYLVQILADYGDSKKVKEGHLKVNDTGGDLTDGYELQ